MTKNVVMLYKLLVNFPDDGENNLAEAMSIQRYLMTYGYMLNEDAFSQLKKTHLSNIVSFHDEVGTALRKYFGGTHSFTPLYKDFPRGIMSESLSELWEIKLKNYRETGVMEYIGSITDPALKQDSYRLIKGTDQNGILEIYKILAGSGQSLTPLDTKVLKYFSKLKDLPIVSVPFKENLAVLAKNIEGFKVSTVVDVLRIAHALSGGDPSLPPLPKLLKTKGVKYDLVKKERDLHKFKLSEKNKLRILNLFENSNMSTSDMQTGAKRGKFINLAHHLKVENFKDSHPKTFYAFNHLRNQVRKGKPEGMPKIRTWNSQVITAFETDFDLGLKKLSERPGEFIRRLDFIYRNNYTDRNKQISIASYLFDAAYGSSNKVILESIGHFESRLNPSNDRSVFIKGAKAKTPLPPLPALPEDAVKSIISTLWSAFEHKLRDLSSLGKVYVDEGLKKIPLPTNMRSMSESLTPFIRGQRFKLDLDEESKVIRSFVHWFDKDGNQDLDLHSYIVSNERVIQLGYSSNNLVPGLGEYSGDVRHRVGACAEYIDLDISKAKELGFKYLVNLVNDYTGRGFHTYSDCVAGTMFLPKMKNSSRGSSNWLPDTISESFLLQSMGKNIVSGIIDLESMEYLPMDTDWDKYSNLLHSSNPVGMLNWINSNTKEPLLNLYDLFHLHAISRGKISNEEDADVRFLFEDYKNDYTAILPWLGV